MDPEQAPAAAALDTAERDWNEIAIVDEEAVAVGYDLHGLPLREVEVARRVVVEEDANDDAGVAGGVAAGAGAVAAGARPAVAGIAAGGGAARLVVLVPRGPL
jgi:hypothetical protein